MGVQNPFLSQGRFSQILLSGGLS